MKDNLNNNKLDDSTLEKVSGGEGNSVGRSEPRYLQGSIVYCREYGRKRFYVISSSYVGLGWEYVIISSSDKENIIFGVKEKDLSYSCIF